MGNIRGLQISRLPLSDRSFSHLHNPPVFSYPTQDTWWPDPFFSILLKNISRCRHGSDTQAYDNQGNFRPERLDLLLKQIPRQPGLPNAISFVDGLLMTQYMRDSYDFFGFFVAKLEWLFLYLLVGQNGYILKDDIVKQYDGTLFYEIEDKRRRKMENTGN